MKASISLPLVMALVSLSGAWVCGNQRPNIVLCISDDQSWEHTGFAGDPVVKTPHFDRIAREGVYFRFAFCSSPSCTPSRAAILTGQDFWRLEEGANLMGTLPKKFAVYPELLEQAGYAVGYSGKGWSPGNIQAGGRDRNPAGPRFNNFRDFLNGLTDDRPFCFWFGSIDPHRPYRKGSGVQSGKKPADVVVPPFLPDAPEVRNDLLDYYVEIERFDRHVGEILDLLADRQCLDDTIVVVTSDNGMPFPRGKTNLYDHGSRMPLAVRWGTSALGGRILDDFVTLTDLAPTFLEAAGVSAPAQLTGHSLLPLLQSNKSGRIDSRRDRVFLGRERHGWNRDPNVGYPSRSVRTQAYQYIRNFAPDRWPAFDTDPSPTKDFLLQNKTADQVHPFFKLWFDRRGSEELYDLKQDPAQINNLIDRPEYAEVKQRLAQELIDYLKRTKDPRVEGQGDAFDKYRYYSQPTGNQRWFKQFQKELGN